MSKTFSSVHRATLINDLKDVTEDNKLLLIKALIDIKISPKQGEYFESDTGEGHIYYSVNNL